MKMQWLDSVGYCLLRNLKHAREDYLCTWNENRSHFYEFTMPASQHNEYHARFIAFSDLAHQFVEHLDVMGYDAASDYREALRQEMMIHEDDRDMGRVEDLVFDAAYLYLEEYFDMPRNSFTIMVSS